MSEDFLGFLIPLCIIPGLLIALIWGPGVLFWFRDKEINDMESLELAIFAAENGFEFEKENGSIDACLTDRYLRPKGKYNIRNIFTHQYDQVNFYKFDYEFQPREAYSQNWIIILVKFDTASFPRFKIDKHNPNLHAQPSLLLLLTSANVSDLPDWAKEKMSIYSTRKARKSLLEYLEDKSEILSLIQPAGFQALAFNADCACLYLKGSLSDNLFEHQRLESKARQIIEIFGNA